MASRRATKLKLTLSRTGIVRVDSDSILGSGVYPRFDGGIRSMKAQVCNLGMLLDLEPFLEVQVVVVVVANYQLQLL